MTDYGRNFEFRVSPRPNNRDGRCKNHTAAIPIGTPVAVDPALGTDPNGRRTFRLATAAVAPQKGIHGIAVFEYAFDAFEGRDPFLTTTSDLDVVPVSAPCQLVNGDDVKVVLRNTTAGLLLGRQYPGRVMVPLGGLAIGDFLGPAAGNDTDGYWAETAEATAWLVVVGIDATRAEVEARMTF